jgi:oxygen-independent coproporphyrinogen-3 oxidase
MQQESRLDSIRTDLFYGLLDYTKSFPDFSIPQRFLMASRKEGKELLESVEVSLRGEKQILLYIHLPFCHSECVFCNASPHKGSREIRSQYVEGLLKEIEIYSKSGMFDEKEAKCVYFGGGTPTTFPSQDIRSILDKVESYLDLAADCTITCEAHPKDLVENDKMEELSQLGVGRISIGCQTFDPKVLELCKRSNPESQVREVIRKARELGLAANIDMMIGLPGQTLEGVRRDLRVLSDIAPDSIEYMRHEIVNPLAISLYRSNP